MVSQDGWMIIWIDGKMYCVSLRYRKGGWIDGWISVSLRYFLW